jgi:hypothetical protein
MFNVNFFTLGGVIMFRGKPPYGYRREDGKLIEDENEQKVIDIIKKDKSLKCSIPNIIQHLSSAGYKNRSGGSFSWVQVKRIAERDAVGTLMKSDITLKDRLERIEEALERIEESLVSLLVGMGDK